MRLMPLTIAASVVLLAGAALAALNTGPADTGELPVDITLVAQSGGPGVTGTSVSGLYPGVKREIQVAVRNPYKFPIMVTAASGQLASTSRKSCKVAYTNLTVGRYAGSPALPARIPAGQQAKLGYLPIWMPAAGVSDACQGVTFTLRLSAGARKAPK
ncbi:hypothetical protein AB0G04_17595 [Actinoplanes sp. NPDC023801]|uniref:hypothetical protein n=1 Tax=Actinoplanes sp. NPDC023801 TaxID=3154595 RepID=UPI0033FAD459